MSEKYDIEEIKQMRLQGLTLKQIADYYSVDTSTIQKYLKRKYGIRFGDLNKTCKYCGKVFKPRKYNQICCSKICLYFHTLKRVYKNKREYYKRKGIHYDPYLTKYLDRRNPTIAYKNAIDVLNTKKEHCICPLCGNSTNFDICRGEIICNVCQLVQD